MSSMRQPARPSWRNTSSAARYSRRRVSSLCFSLMGETLPGPMCTLVVCIRQYGAFPLIVAANRDENLSRPATGPRKWLDLPFVAPRDELAFGTWLGLTRSGLFVGVTNRFLAPKHEGRESRGQLVVEALQAPDATTLHTSLRTLSASRFNAFHLVYTDDTGAYVTWSDGEVVRHETLAPGLHIITERSLGGDDHARTSLIHERWPQLSPHGAVPTPEALQGLLAATKPDDPLGGVCVEAPAFNYGTRSSMVLFQARDFAQSRLWWADGRPDRTPFVERSELVRELLA
ncbi:MAG: NRDE family protein [Myxococcaceae bacterium]|nr:NRDE family protein [Myxococcaceae bacterium]